MLYIFLQDAAAQAGGGLEMLLMILVMIAIVYFFMIRPQNKRRKEIQQFQSSLQVGQEVMLSNGVHGTVKDLNPDKSYVTVEIANGVKVNVERNCIYNSQLGQTQA